MSAKKLSIFGSYNNRCKLFAELPIRVKVLLGIEWSQSVQSFWKQRYPEDERPQKALNAANDFVISFINPPSLVVANSFDAYNENDGRVYASYSVAGTAMYVVVACLNSPNDSGNTIFTVPKLFKSVYDLLIAPQDDSNSDIANVAYLCHRVGTRWSWLQSTYERTKGPSYPFDPEWRTTTAIQLAKQVLVNKELECMPILADALQDAGFTDTNWLTYLQSGRDEWVRSNWLIWNLLELDTEKIVCFRP